MKQIRCPKCGDAFAPEPSPSTSSVACPQCGARLALPKAVPKADPTFRIVEVLDESAPSPRQRPSALPWKPVAVIGGLLVLGISAAVILMGGKSSAPEPVPSSRHRPIPLFRPVGTSGAEIGPPERKAGSESVPDPVPAPTPQATGLPPPATPPATPPAAASPKESWARIEGDFQKALGAERFDEADQILKRAQGFSESGASDGLRVARQTLTLRRMFSEQRPGAITKVEGARKSYLKEVEDARGLELAIEKLLKNQTARAPFRLVLQDGYAIDNVRVASYAGGRVRFVWPQGEMDHSLESLPRETQRALLEGALEGASSRECLEVGKLFVHGGSFDLADRCFKKAVGLDPDLGPLCPDLVRLRQLSKVFEGDFKLMGNLLGVRWAFREPAEAGDFKSIKGKCAVSPRQGLEFSGDKISYATIREVPFRDQLKISAVGRKSEKTAHLLGVSFVRPDGGEVLIYAIMATGLKAFLVKRVEDHKTTEIVPTTPYGGDDRLEMDFNRGRFVFRIGGKSLWSGMEGGFTDIWAILGGSSLGGEGASPTVEAAFSEVRLQGGVNPEWVRKEVAGYRSVLASELSREHRIRAGQKEESSSPLSLDVLLPEEEDSLRGLYQQAMQALRDYLAGDRKVGIEVPRRSLEELTIRDPHFASAWFARAALEEVAGNLREAARHLDRALENLRDFPEALAMRARLHILDGEWAKAGELALRALALKPDLGEAHLVRARLQLEEGKGADALASAGIARWLSAGNQDLEAEAQMLGNLVRGPGWARANEHRTAHYVVRSDLAAEKCRTFAENLEAMRVVYEQVVPFARPTQKAAQVLIFNTHEGYHSYMDFTSGDRLEHTLGVFSPWYGQMVLFEDPEPEETLRVLYHEGFHQYLKGIIPEAPIWFNEGMAEYVGASRLKDGKVVETGGLQVGRLRNLKGAVKYGWKPHPFREIMNESQAEFYGKDASFQYAQAWSMIHFFMHGDAGKWRGLLANYARRLSEGASGEEAFADTFGKEPLEDLEASWGRYYLLLEAAPGGAPKAAPATAGAATAKSAEAAEVKKARELRINGLRDSLSAKDEKVRIRAIYELGEIRDRNSRSLLADKLGSDTLDVRRAAAAALSKQKHPAAAAALGNALASNRNNSDTLGYLIAALEDLDMDDSIKPLLTLLEFKEYDALEPVLAAIEKIGCPHAIPELLKWLRRAENEEKKPGTNHSKDLKLAAWPPRIRYTLGKISGGSPRPGETWDQFVDRGGAARKLTSLYYCEVAGKTFEAPAGKGKPDCPFTEPSDHHEDTLLKHRPE